jgi:hypothetical protein
MRLDFTRGHYFQIAGPQQLLKPVFGIVFGRLRSRVPETARCLQVDRGNNSGHNPPQGLVTSGFL